MMKHKILSMMGAGLLILTTWSCREQSDALTAYDYNESLVFSAADTSFAAKFQVMWNGMNQYYALWDYEAEQGLDWDAVYDEYYPQFAALDQRGKDETVTDDELKALMDKVFAPLHDGHFYMMVTNHKTGSSVITMPSSARAALRDDYIMTANFSPSLSYYANVANGEVETDTDGNPIMMEHSTYFNDMMTAFSTVEGRGSQWIIAKINELKALSSPTEMEAFLLLQLLNLVEELQQITGKNIPEAIVLWNNIQQKYSFLNIPGFDPIDPGFATKDIKVQFALLKGNIAYLSLNKFQLTSYLEDKESQSTFNMDDPGTQQHIAQIRQIWQSWFDTVQQLHKNGTLGGVIIDVRNNGGGNVNDSQYVVGSLVPAGGIHFGYQRFKRGAGRYDYSPMMPAVFSSMSDPHETITEPVVILINSHSVSMSESSALCTKTLSNGTVIGKRSFGGICALTDNDASSYNYSGFIGVQDVTSVFGYVPSMASFTLDKKLVEAEGVTPDIEVDLDLDLFKATGKDTQIDRALQFIRTGK